MSYKPIESTPTKIVGVSSDTKDKNGVPFRQKYLQVMQEKNIQSLELRREPENPWDTNAIAVWAKLPIGPCKIGYIQNKTRYCEQCNKFFEDPKPNQINCEKCSSILERRGLATTLSSWIDQGIKYKARVLQFTQAKNSDTIGCNIQIDRIY